MYVAIVRLLPKSNCVRPPHPKGWGMLRAARMDARQDLEACSQEGGHRIFGQARNRSEKSSRSKA